MVHLSCITYAKWTWIWAVIASKFRALTPDLMFRGPTLHTLTPDTEARLHTAALIESTLEWKQASPLDLPRPPRPLFRMSDSSWATNRLCGSLADKDAWSFWNLNLRSVPGITKAWFDTFKNTPTVFALEKVDENTDADAVNMCPKITRPHDALWFCLMLLVRR